MHTSPRTVASCPHLIANRVAVVLFGPLGHFLFLWLLTVLWVNMGQTLNNFKEHLFHTKSIIVSFFGLEKPCQPVWPDSWGSPIRHHPPDVLEEKVCNTCQTWGEVWARAVMVMREGCSAVSSMPNWAVPDCMERPRPDRRRLHYLYWNRWCVSGILHRRLGSFSEGSLLYLSPKLREQRCRYLENRLREPAVPFDPKGPSHYIFIVWFT